MVGSIVGVGAGGGVVGGMVGVGFCCGMFVGAIGGWWGVCCVLCASFGYVVGVVVGAAVVGVGRTEFQSKRGGGSKDLSPLLFNVPSRKHSRENNDRIVCHCVGGRVAPGDGTVWKLSSKMT